MQAVKLQSQNCVQAIEAGTRQLESNLQTDWTELHVCTYVSVLGSYMYMYMYMYVHVGIQAYTYVHVQCMLEA